MSLIENKTALAEGFHLGSQTPIDDRLVFDDLTDLQDLSSDKPYKYYEGMRVWVKSLGTEYEWKESPVGALVSSFLYPSNIVANGVVYSNRSFNFVETGSISLSGIASVFTTTVSLAATVPLVVNVPTAADIINISIYNSSGEDITNGINKELTAIDDITLESNVDLPNIVVKATFNV